MSSDQDLANPLSLKNQRETIAFWVGGFRLHLSSSTEGSLLLSEVLPIDGLQTKVDNGLAKVEDTQIMVDEWWSDLTPQEQKNPVNVAKYETADRVLQTAGNALKLY